MSAAGRGAARLWRLTSRAGTVMILPALVAHELTHYLFAIGATDDCRIVFDAPEAAVLADWRDDAPRWRVALAHLAPALVGLLAAPFVLVLALSTAPAVALILLANWLVYSWPSKDDRTLPA